MRVGSLPLYVLFVVRWVCRPSSVTGRVLIRVNRTWVLAGLTRPVPVRSLGVLLIPWSAIISWVSCRTLR